jgi:hypothetical protein
MASLSDDPQLARSLWLQLRSSRRRTRRRPWRTDWLPAGILVLLMGILIIFSVMMPSDDPPRTADHSGNQIAGEHSPVIGAVAGP